MRIFVLFASPMVFQGIDSRTNPFQEGENDAIQIASSPFTRSQARELQCIKGLCMKLGVLELVLVARRDSHAWKNAWGSAGKKIGAATLGEQQEPLGASPIGPQDRRKLQQAAKGEGSIAEPVGDSPSPLGEPRPSSPFILIGSLLGLL